MWSDHLFFGYNDRDIFENNADYILDHFNDIESPEAPPIRMKNFQNWRSTEIMEWICEEHDKCNKCYENFPLKNFRSVTNFAKMTKEDFVNLSESKEDGEFLYERKQLLMGESLSDDSQFFKIKNLNHWTSRDIMFWIIDEFSKNNKDYETVPLRKFANIDIVSLKRFTKNEFVDLVDSLEDGEFLYKCKEDLFYNYYHARCNEDKLHSVDSCPSPNENGFTNEGSSRKPGRPRTKNRTEVDKIKRSGKLWEFLRNLLMDSSTCPSLIKWDNFNEGTFKFVQSEKVAKLWGDRKKNSNMNYEKFSRAMRYYYRSQVLLPVSGKRLVYKFGPNATGWKNIKPIL